MKLWALVLVVALGIVGWVLPAQAGKVVMTDQELDEVSGGAKSTVSVVTWGGSAAVVTGGSSAAATGRSAAAVVTPFGSAAAGGKSAFAVVTPVGSAAAGFGISRFFGGRRFWGF